MSLELEWAVVYFSPARHHANAVRCGLFLLRRPYLTIPTAALVCRSHISNSRPGSKAAPLCFSIGSERNGSSGQMQDRRTLQDFLYGLRRILRSVRQEVRIRNACP
jgi:hypothetical protein